MENNNQTDVANVFKAKIGRTISDVNQNNRPPSGYLPKGKGLDRSGDTPHETTFQARIADRPTGSSSTNWRRTEPPPHVAGPTPTKRLLAELVAQRQDDRRYRDKEDEKAKRRAELEEQTQIASTVASVVRRMSDDDILQPDGSNLRRWERMLSMHASEQFQDPDFYCPKEEVEANETHEKIARGIINTSVHRDLIYDLLSLGSSSEVYTHLLMKFWSINRAAQLQAWQRFTTVDPSKFNTTAGILAAFNDVAKSFDEMAIELSFDDMMGLIIQSNLRNHHRAAFDQKVELFMETHDYQHPSAQEMLRLLDATRTEQKLAEDNRMTDSTSLRLDLASRPNVDKSETTEDREVNALAINKLPKCYICKKPGHIAPDCPSKKRGTPQTLRHPQSRMSPHPFPPCSVTYNFDKLPYIRPLQPEAQASTSSSTPPRDSSKTLPKQVEAKMIDPDIFAEEEEYVFEPKDVSAEPSGMRFNLRELALDHEGQEVIWDSGASDNVTGDRYALHDFTVLDQPIAVRVATDTSRDYITGTGTLKFSGMNGTIITIRKVYFCERARSTLLSMAAIKKANGCFRVNGNFDSIDLLTSTGKLLLRSTFDPRSNTWPLPRPIRNSTFSPKSSPTSCNTVNHHDVNLQSIFKSPNLIEHSEFTWKTEDLTPDEKILLFWHRLFGHASLRKIRQLVKLQLGYGLPTKMPSGSIKCPVCSICKATRKSVLGPTNRCLERLSVVCVDLMGPFNPPTMTGGKYALTIRDVFTSYSEVKILKTKAEAAESIMETTVRWETQTGCRLKVLRSDNGGEFDSKVFAKFLSDKGVLAERSLPYHHFQNGAAKRYNRTVADMGRSILYDSRLGKQFWGYSFMWSAWTLNRIPNQITKDKTPYECFFGDKPQLDRT
jgi:hypothetical protein